MDLVAGFSWSLYSHRVGFEQHFVSGISRSDSSGIVNDSQVLSIMLSDWHNRMKTIGDDSLQCSPECLF